MPEKELKGKKRSAKSITRSISRATRSLMSSSTRSRKSSDRSSLLFTTRRRSTFIRARLRNCTDQRWANAKPWNWSSLWTKEKRMYGRLSRMKTTWIMCTNRTRKSLGAKALKPKRWQTQGQKAIYREHWQTWQAIRNWVSATKKTHWTSESQAVPSDPRSTRPRRQAVRPSSIGSCS